jgi:hypothetical protein
MCFSAKPGVKGLIFCVFFLGDLSYANTPLKFYISLVIKGLYTFSFLFISLINKTLRPCNPKLQRRIALKFEASA